MTKRRVAKNERLDVAATLEKYGCTEMVAGRKWARKLKIEINPRMRSYFGWASYGTHTIELSPRTFVEGFESTRETLTHELCHFIAYFDGGERGHGELFHRLMRKWWSPEHHGKRWHQTPISTERKAAESGRMEWVKKQNNPESAA